MRRYLICLGLLAVPLVGIHALTGQGQGPAASNEEAIRKASAAFTEALNKGNVDGIMAYWAPDADFIDEAGKKTKGHDALRARLETKLSSLKGSKFRGNINSIKFLRPDVALVDGTVETLLADGERDANRYAVIWVKSGSKWLISSARDWPAEVEDLPSLSYLKLKSLEWLVGNWSDDAGKVRVKCTWTPNKSFLRMEYEVKNEAAEPLLVTQRIGWDPVNDMVRSWVFDSTGGFGEGYWTRDGNRWIVGASGILADGGTGGATNIYEFKDNNTILYRSVDREVDGQPVADVETRLVRKVAK